MSKRPVAKTPTQLLGSVPGGQRATELVGRSVEKRPQSLVLLVLAVRHRAKDGTALSGGMTGGVDGAVLQTGLNH
jgi:hypothetical protein